MEWIDILYDVLIFLIPGYLVLGISLWLLSKLSKRHTDIAKQLLSNLGWIIMAICLLTCIQWYYCRVYCIYSSTEEYNQYALRQRLFGKYWFLYWMPILFSVPVLFLNFFKANRIMLWNILLGFLVCGLPFYNIFLDYVIMSNRDFISSTWQLETIEEPNFGVAILFGLLKVAICLLIISIPVLVKFIRKR